MNQITEIYLDLDDTLNVLTFNFLAFEDLHLDQEDYPHVEGYAIVQVRNSMLPEHLHLSDSEYWDRVPQEWWEWLPLSQFGEELIIFAETVVGRDNVYILTKPTHNPSCAAGKVAWIRKYLPDWLHDQFLIGSPKHCCAKPTALLIDDNQHNTDKFVEHGGHAILVPQPWNRLRGHDQRTHLFNEFGNYASST